MHVRGGTRDRRRCQKTCRGDKGKDWGVGGQDRNETLFYRVLLDNFSEMAPIVYTPTVGWACLNYHKLYRRPRGMFFCAKDKGEMNSMMWNWPGKP